SPLKTEKLSRGRVQVFCVGVVAFVIVALAPIFIHAVQAQKSRVRRAPATRKTTAPGVDYSRFSHATKKHQGACNTCHKVPTDNWKKAGDFPDVADFPGHDACVSCHRAQFFKGAKPTIC